MYLGLRARAVTRDAQLVSIGGRSHLQIEIKDDGVDVVEYLLLSNRATAPYDAGPDGIVFHLPAGAPAAPQAGVLLRHHAGQPSDQASSLSRYSPPSSIR